VPPADLSLTVLPCLAGHGPRVEFTGGGGDAPAGAPGGGAPAAAISGDVAAVEAKFYGDGTWNKVILGAQLGPDRQQVKFVGYEDDGWQDTAAKDIRYPAVKVGGSKVDMTSSANGAAGTAQKATEKKVKAGKGGRSGKKWEVVSGFMEATAGGSAKGGGKSAKAAVGANGTGVPAATGDKGAAPAPASHQPASPPPSTTATPTKPRTRAGGGREGEQRDSVRELAAAAAAEETRAAVASAAAALTNASTEAPEGGALGVSYDLLTAVTERLDDVALFDPSQTDEEGLTAVLTTADGAIRFIEMCRRIIQRICTLEAINMAPAKTRADIEAFLLGREWVKAGAQSLVTPRGRFAGENSPKPARDSQKSASPLTLALTW